MNTDYIIAVASSEHLRQAESISAQMALSAINRGTGIGGRTPDHIRQIIQEGRAVIAALPDGQWIGFTYLDVWEGGAFVSQSGLIVDPAYRQHGVARHLKQALFALSRYRYPQAKLFSITTTQAVMRLNGQLGFDPVAFSELPQDARFWEQCKTCQNCDILARTRGKYCLCTALLFDPAASRATLTHDYAQGT